MNKKDLPVIVYVITEIHDGRSLIKGQSFYYNREDAERELARFTYVPPDSLRSRSMWCGDDDEVYIIDQLYLKSSTP